MSHGLFDMFIRTAPAYSFLSKDILHCSVSDKRAYRELRLSDMTKGLQIIISIILETLGRTLTGL